jgi:hypothetical protein
VEHVRIGFVANLDHGERVRYYEWWKKYIFIRRLSWLCVGVAVLCLADMTLKMPLQPVASAFLKADFLAAIVLAIWTSFLECPRCGESFRGWGRQNYFSDECQNCGLTMGELSAIGKPQT